MAKYASRVKETTTTTGTGTIDLNGAVTGFRGFLDPSEISDQDYVPYILHDAGGLKLREHTVDCGQPNVFPGTNQRFVHVFGTHMLFIGFLEDLEDPQPRQRCFQAGFLEVGSFQFGQTFRLISHVMNSSDGLLIGYTASPLAVCFRV